MKKLLIASTALVATAGMAAADGHTGVSLSGTADMGIHSSDRAADYFTDGDVRLYSSVDVSFNMSAESDSGLTFGAKIDLDEAAKTNRNAEAVWVKGGFGNLTMGDTDGAMDWAMTETAMGTALTDDHTEHGGYNGNSIADSGTILRYDNTFGDFGVALSAGNVGFGAGSDEVIQLGVKYNTEIGGAGLGLGLGYADNGTDSLLGLSVKTSVAGFDVVLNYTDADNDASHMGIGLGYKVGDVLLHANWGEYDDGTTKTDGYALAVNYGLGGGTTFAAGYGSDDAGDTMSLGLVMSF